jgi:flagellar biosynthesis protein FlhF
VKTYRFIADNAATALAQIHAQLGPEAVVLSVRPLAPRGVAKLWQRRVQIEVVAGVPDKTSAPQPDLIFFPQNIPEKNGDFVSNDDRWRSVAWLEMMGLLSTHAARLQTHLRSVHGDAPPDSLDEEWKIVNGALSRFWLKPPALDNVTARPHVFIGPPGSGKSTAICKWLTLATLLEGRAARVWRLDGNTANTAEFLAIHCEMLGVPLERFWSPEVRSQKSEDGNQKTEIGNPTSDLRPPTSELWFVDLPGVEIADKQALNALREQIATLPSPRVHLVLNAAYEMPALLAQWRAFEACQPEDLIFTHLDEETRRVKLWNFVFGTNCSLRFLGAGQKIPGQFRNASPEILFPSKTL